MTTDKLMKLADAYADESALVGLACGKTEFDAALKLIETRRNDAHQALRAAIEQAQCNPHPDAPHGFDRNGSHSADRYVCTCEGWVPDVPKGWVLVPVEPTPEMLAVAMKRGGHYGYDYEIKAEWQAMLAAAPKGGA